MKKVHHQHRSVFCLNYHSVQSGLILFLFFLFSFNGLAQAPACNVNGALKACLNQGDITISTEIVYGTPNPQINHLFAENSSGASIVSVGPYQYDATTGIGKQSVVVNPGSQAGTFNMRLIVNTPDGQTSTCSKSVTVIECKSIMGKQ